jgi:exopolysaccharide biosynthesis polyprenyl glycosylphosphotransferase
LSRGGDASVLNDARVQLVEREQDAPQAEFARGRSRAQRRRLLAGADGVGVVVATLIVVSGAAILHDASRSGALGAMLVLTFLTYVLWRAMAGICGIYRRDELRHDLTTADDVGPILVTVSLTTWCLFLASTLASAELPNRVLVSLWLAMLVMVLFARTLGRALTRRDPQYAQNTIIVGAGDIGQLLGRKLAHHPELGLRLVGFVDERPKPMRQDLADVPVLGTPAEVRRLVGEHNIDRIIVAFSNEPHGSQLDLVHELRDLDVEIDLVPRLFEAMGPTVGMHYVEGVPLVTIPTTRSRRLAWTTKRAIDIACATLGLVILSPLFLAVAWRIKRDSPGPVFFRQERLGQDMRPFELRKFRTMHVETDELPHREYVRTLMDTSMAPADNNLYKLNREADVTKSGGWLRRTSVDELPQLINVLRGDMSLVGPRPCLSYETDLFEPHHFDRFLVPAGITGLWQVTARARSTFKEALDLDAAYAQNWSLGLDLKLMMKTPFVMIRARGTA